MTASSRASAPCVTSDSDAAIEALAELLAAAVLADLGDERR